MKELSGTAATLVAAEAEACLEMLAAVDRYSDWYPEVITHAEILERAGDGAPVRAAATVHVSVGPVQRKFDLLLEVDVGDRHVRLLRIAHDHADGEHFEVRCTVLDGERTELQVALQARLDVPRFLPLGDVGDSVAQGFVEAARRVLDGSSPNASASSS